MTENENSVTLMRKLLGSVDLSDVGDDEMNEGERIDYCGAISAVWPRLESDIKRFMHAQLMFQATTAKDWDQVVFSRGTFNGLSLLLEHWRAAHTEHNTRFKQEDNSLLEL